LAGSAIVASLLQSDAAAFWRQFSGECGSFEAVAVELRQVIVFIGVFPKFLLRKGAG
jgi:hypothetical protein